jgi:hypothetical protein
MELDIGVLLNDWLKEQNSEWFHTKKLEWKGPNGEEGTATSDLGFIVHPVSKHLDEVLWISEESVSNPLLIEPLKIADPEFFDKLSQSLTTISKFFRQNPDRENRSRSEYTFMRYNLTSTWGWYIKYGKE